MNTTDIEMHYVESSNVAKIGWHNSYLYVLFVNGGHYRYIDVPKALFQEMLEAESVGKYLNAVIKPGFKFERLD